jgi:anti-anti-sigma factor
MFFINHTDIGDNSAAIIEIEGPLNSDSSPGFYDYLNNLMENNYSYLLLDMKDLKFISSEGIGAILMIQKKINEKKGLALFFNLNREISSLFRLLGFDKVFTTAEDRADALHILDRHMELNLSGNFPQQRDIADEPEKFFPDEEISIREIEEDESEPVNPVSSAKSGSHDDATLDPFIIECVKCRSLIRIKHSGDHFCPYCNAEFTVDSDKNAVFEIREVH